jgi:hypothetical protein
MIIVQGQGTSFSKALRLATFCREGFNDNMVSKVRTLAFMCRGQTGTVEGVTLSQDKFRILEITWTNLE